VRPDLGASQTRVQVTPYFTGHFPLVASNRLVATGKVSLGQFKRTVAPGFGAKLTDWISREFAAEADVKYVTSGTRVDLTTPGAVSPFQSPGHELNATGRLVYRPLRSPVLLGLGAGYIGRGGEAWRDQLVEGAGRFNKHHFTTVVSVGGLVLLSRWLPLLVAVEGLVYWVQKYEPTENDFNRRIWMQADIQARVGVPIGL
jgi:hypothetical protein